MAAKKETTTMSIPAAIIVGAVIVGIALIVAFGGNTGGTIANTGGEAGDGRPNITEAAKKVGVNVRDLESCVENEETLDLVQADMLDAQQSGGRGTPYSVIVGPNGDTFPVSGAQDAAIFNLVIDHLIAGTPRSDDVVDFADPNATQLINQSIARNNGALPQLANDLTVNVQPVTPDEPVRGNPDATVTVIEFSDIDCPFCQRAHPTFESLVESRNDVKWVYRHLPLTQLHPEAQTKAVAAECVRELSDDETYWEYLDLLIQG